ncbi:hypothetical protein ACN47E_000280 [Coniothyrium glycines]
MFHEGSLQSGIARAIQEQKLVACFVQDEGATSKTWEQEWLKSGWIESLLSQKAVLLRLQAGSTEAGFLAAFCDVTSPPTFVVIHNGQLQVQLKSDVDQNTFVNSVRTALGGSPIPGASAVQTPNPQANTSVTQASQVIEDQTYSAPEPSHTTSIATPVTPTAGIPSSVAKGKQRVTSPPATSSVPSTGTASKAQQAARDALRKKKKEEAEELARVKARIEADKAERRAQAEARRTEREKERNAEVQSETQLRITTTSRGSQAKDVKLSIRLFDGRTIRQTFPRTAKLQDEIRAWIDKRSSELSQDDPNINNEQLPPYYFRHILAPQPSRELSAGDENQTLGDIDLAPSATLVLVPVKGYTEAYGGGGGGVVGTATGLVGGAFGLLSSTVSYVGSTLGSFIGSGPAPQTQTGQTTGSPSSQSSQQPITVDEPRVRVRTLADQRAREPQQFYNGNQLSTEPRVDDDDKRS